MGWIGTNTSSCLPVLPVFFALALGPHPGVPTAAAAVGAPPPARTDADASPSASHGRRRRMAAGAHVAASWCLRIATFRDKSCVLSDFRAPLQPARH